MVVTKVRETTVTTTITEAVVTPMETGQPSMKIISEKANSKVKMRAKSLKLATLRGTADQLLFDIK